MTGPSVSLVVKRTRAESEECAWVPLAAKDPANWVRRRRRVESKEAWVPIEREVMV
jgi:hypothetical protein